MNKRRKSKGEVAVVVECAVVGFLVAIQLKSVKLNTAVDNTSASRLETLQSSGSQYPETAALLDNYKLVTSGDYLLFCIDEHADAMVEAFNTYAK